MGRMQRQKGKRGERECAAEFAAMLGEHVHARRGAQHRGGADSPDVQLDGVPIHIECKRTESLSIYTALEQATRDAPDDRCPIVWHRRNGRESLLIVRTIDALRLATALIDAMNKCDTTTNQGNP